MVTIDTRWLNPKESLTLPTVKLIAIAAYNKSFYSSISSSSEVIHNQTAEIQGGSELERYHLTLAEHSALIPLTGSAFTSSAQVTHNSTTGLQGGTSGQYYHLSSTEYSGLGLLLAHSASYNSVSTNTSLNSSHFYVEVTAAAVTITLPTAVSISGRPYIVINSSSGTIFVNTTGTQTINGILTQSVPSECSISVVSNGTNWRIF